MKRTITTLGLAAVVFCVAGSCKNTEAASATSEKETTEMTTDKGTTKGGVSNDVDEATMVMGTIMFSDKEGDCPYTIKTDDGRMFDPINMDESFQEDGMKVKFTFSGLRMPNRCTMANPIRLESIKMQ